MKLEIETMWRRKQKILYSVIIFIISSIFYLVATLGLAQTVESARQKFDIGNYEAAEEELKEIVKQNSDNIEALELLSKVEEAKKKKESKLLTKKALIAINNRDFQRAYTLLEKAILIDPENNQAQDLYLSITEVIRVEKKSEKEEAQQKSEEIAKAEEVPAAATSKTEQKKQVQGEKVKPKETGVQEVPEVKEKTTGVIAKAAEKPKLFKNRLYLQLATSYAFASSNRLSYIDSKISMIGGSILGVYYFDFWKRMFGVLFDYDGLFFKTSGNEYIRFRTHRTNISVLLRYPFFADSRGNRLTAGIRLNYHIFLLENLEQLGAYNFKKLYGPSIGGFLSDPVLYRFFQKELFKNLGFNGEFNVLYVVSKNAPVSPEFYIGAYYCLKQFRFNLGYRSYMIFKGSVKERYNDIEAGAGYVM